nr:TPA_asm: hypothetical protein [Becan tricladivirus 1]
MLSLQLDPAGSRADSLSHLELNFHDINLNSFDYKQLCYLSGLCFLAGDNVKDRTYFIDFNLINYLNKLRITTSGAGVIEQRSVLLNEFDFLADLFWDKSKVNSEYSKLKVLANNKCNNDISIDMAVEYEYKQHEGLERFGRWDNDNIRNLCNKARDVREYCNVRKNNNSGCFMNNGRVSCSRQVLRCLSFLYSVLKDDVKDKWLIKVIECHLVCGLGVKNYVEVAKQLTVVSKKGRELFFQDGWFALIDLNTWAGYNMAADLDSEVSSQVPNWIKDRLEVEKIEADLWKCLQSKAMDKYFTTGISDDVTLNNRRSGSFRDWVSNPDNWVTAGASNVKGKVYTKGNEWVKTKGNKGNVAYFLTVDEIVEKCLKLKESELKPVVKVELGKKNRLIIKVDDYVNLIASYTGRMAMRMLKGNLNSSLFMNVNQQYNMWLGWYKNLRGSNSFSYPYDAPSFDQRIKTVELENYFDWKRRLLDKTITSEHKQEFLDMCDLAKEQYFNQYCIVDGKKVRLEHGMVSGYFDTAIGDSVISVSRNKALIDSINAAMSRAYIPKDNSVGQGDDFCSVGDSLLLYCLHFKVVNECGWGAHKEKNYIATDNCEFLRKYCSVAEVLVRGYLSRKIPGLLYRDPIKRGGAIGIPWLRERVGQLNVLACRGADVSKVEALMLNEITMIRKSKKQMFNRYDSMSIALTPASFGGAGIHLNLPNKDVKKPWCKVNKLTDDEDKKDTPVLSGVYLENYNTAVEMIESEFKHDLLDNQLVGQLVDETKHDDFLYVTYSKKVKVGGSYVTNKLMVAPRKIIGVAGWMSRPGLMKTVASDAIKSCISRKKWEFLKYLVDDVSITRVVSMSKRWKRATFYDWLDGKLGLKSPLVLGYSSSETAILNNYFANRFWIQIFDMKEVTEHALSFQNYSVECSVVRALRSNVLPIKYSD